MARWNMDIPPCDAAEYARLKRIEAAAEALLALNVEEWGLVAYDALLCALTEDLIEEPANG